MDENASSVFWKSLDGSVTNLGIPFEILKTCFLVHVNLPSIISSEADFKILRDNFLSKPVQENEKRIYIVGFSQAVSLNPIVIQNKLFQNFELEVNNKCFSHNLK